MNIAIRPRTMRAFGHALSRDPVDDGIDLDRFRAAMRVLPGAVTVIATASGAQRFGLTATAVCSLSAEPPRLLACVNQGGATFAAIRAAGAFSVNVLAEGQEEVARHFAGMAGPGADRFAAGDWAEGVDALPVLSGGRCSFECRVSEMIDSVSHAIVVGDIVRAHTRPEQAPLLWCDGAFAGLARFG